MEAGLHEVAAGDQVARTHVYVVARRAAVIGHEETGAVIAIMQLETLPPNSPSGPNRARSSWVYSAGRSRSGRGIVPSVMIDDERDAGCAEFACDCRHAGSFDVEVEMHSEVPQSSPEPPEGFTGDVGQRVEHVPLQAAAYDAVRAHCFECIQIDGGIQDRGAAQIALFAQRPDGVVVVRTEQAGCGNYAVAYAGAFHIRQKLLSRVDVAGPGPGARRVGHLRLPDMGVAIHQRPMQPSP